MKKTSKIQEGPMNEAPNLSPFKISTYGADMTLEILSKKVDEGEIEIPEFQRNFVWPLKKASRLVESILLGLPVPQIFLYRDSVNQKLIIVDGLQRLKTVNAFFHEELRSNPFRLSGVSTAWEGRKYSELPDVDKRRFKNYILRATIFEQTDPRDDTSVFEIFERLNTGGMSLTPQEVRNSVVRGRINAFLKELNQYGPWRELFAAKEPDLRMRDIEAILRFYALLEEWKNYKKPMSSFLTTFMRSKSNLSKKESDAFKRIFEATIDAVYADIGKRAFKLKNTVNIPILDSLLVGVATNLHALPQNLKNRHAQLLKNESYLESIEKSTSDTERVHARIKLAIQAFHK